MKIIELKNLKKTYCLEKFDVSVLRGINNFSFDELVISPLSIFNSQPLETVKDAYLEQ